MKTGPFIECAGIIVRVRFVSENTETAPFVKQYNGHGNRNANEESWNGELRESRIHVNDKKLHDLANHRAASETWDLSSLN